MANSIQKKIDKIKDDVLSEFEVLSKNIETIDSKLLDKISDVDTQFNNYQEEIEEVTNKSERAAKSYKKTILKEFKQFTTTLKDNFDDMIEQEESLLKSQKDFQQEVKNNLSEIQKTNEQLLQNIISSRSNLKELLQTILIPEESGIAIENTISEYHKEYNDINEFLNETKKSYDQKIEDSFKSIYHQFRQISDHILKIQYKILDSLEPAESLEDKPDFQEIKEADQVRTNFRQNKFKPLSNYDDGNDNIEALITKIEETVSEENILYISQKDAPDEMPAFTLPITLAENQEWEDRNERYLSTYGLNQEVESCYEDNEFKEKYKSYKPFINELTQEEFEYIRMDKQQKKDLLEGLKELYEKDYIKQEHYQLIKKHLKMYDLLQLKRRG